MGGPLGAAGRSDFLWGAPGMRGQRWVQASGSEPTGGLKRLCAVRVTQARLGPSVRPGPRKAGRAAPGPRRALQSPLPASEELGAACSPWGSPCRAWRSVWERPDAQGPPPCLTRFPCKLPGKIPGERAG